MDRTRYHEMTSAQDTQRQNAWAFILGSWHTPEWKPIPQGTKNILGLHSSIGMYSGMLCTKASADGASDFIRRINSRKVQ